jgi:hypothetical protein
MDIYKRRKRFAALQGQAPLAATVYELEKLRCNLCGNVYTASAPPEAGEKKYDESAASMIAMLRYGNGFPWNRLENLEDSLAHLRHFAIQSRHSLLIPHSAESLLRGNLVSRVSQSNTIYSFLHGKVVMMVTQERNLVRPHPNQRFPHLSAPRR